MKEDSIERIAADITISCIAHTGMDSLQRDEYAKKLANLYKTIHTTVWECREAREQPIDERAQ